MYRLATVRAAPRDRITIGRPRPGFVLSVCVVLVNYVIGNNAEIAATRASCRFRWECWLPNLILVVLPAIVLMTRMGRWLGERQRREGPMSKIRRWWRRMRMQREAARSAPGHDRPTTPSPRIQVEGPRRIAFDFRPSCDRYLTVRLIAPLLLVLASTAGSTSWWTSPIISTTWPRPGRRST